MRSGRRQNPYRDDLTSAPGALRLWPCVEHAVALFDPASAFVPRNRGADVVWASPLAFSGDFLLCLAGCQGKHLIIEARRAALAVC
jgi:hypothetical protein